VLEELGISSAIRYLLEEFSQHHPIRIAKMEIDEIDDLFSQPAQTHIFRVIQESLTNIFRHAHASQISVMVKNESDRVAIVGEDNGQVLTRGSQPGTRDRHRRNAREDKNPGGNSRHLGPGRFGDPNNM
jgi:signal transduction histidine kinase